MNDRYLEACRLLQGEIIVAAESKLGRQLSQHERAGIERIDSLGTLESLERSFTTDGYSADKVVENLRYFASQLR